MFKKLQKAEGEDKGMTKDFNDMRAVIDTSATSHGQTYFKEDYQKALQNRNDLEGMFEVTIDTLKQIILKKEEG